MGRATFQGLGMASDQQIPKWAEGQPPVELSPPLTGGDPKPGWPRWLFPAAATVVALVMLSAIFDSILAEPDADAASEPVSGVDRLREPGGGTPSPAVPATVVDAAGQSAIFEFAFEGARSEIVDVLEASRDAESVDRVEAVTASGDPEDLAVYLAVTSGWRVEGTQRDSAWSIARAISYFWSDDYWNIERREPIWWPALDLTVDVHRYECSGETMALLADRRLDRAGWESACSVLDR